MRVVLLGDSHLARLQRALPRIGPDVVNAAVGGAVATDVAAQAVRVPVTPTDVVVLSIGTNDGMPVHAIAPESVRAALTDVAARVRPARWVYLLPPLPESAAHGGAAVAALDATGSLVVVDTPALLEPLGGGAFLPDGLHLTGEAYDVLLPVIAEAVRRD
ncbi:SGNH/GDSL hydrolase family protein [Nocardioides rubriscoriae]|uniref:SGNH/GDSL hydrolase family protein n=1 Tax=Nocardioides rubriscoriae TaxID=642762 RepID=UPI0011DFDD9C|nr:SGNH/GDSL hydrolase family protein [Nocardioides rubriscoriae]